ncbi:MAG: 5'-methylthioadenosine/adenosylhomocysteine nucleosidase [Eubacteriales bacterium]|nr:5'-methylthioadenosine/adenosylhomocysteine nucleosidase [Eubacteriales bacterium]
MTGIICAMDLELEGFLKNMSVEETLERSGMTFYKGKIKNSEAVIAQCGVGKVNAAICTQIMIDFFAPQLIVNSGVAGALDERLTVCDLVIGDFALQHDMDGTALGEEKGNLDLGGEQRVRLPLDRETSEKLMKLAENYEGSRVYLGTVASGDKFVSDTRERLSIGRQFDALACEMEGASMAHVCYRAKVPCAIVRAISDDLTHNTGMSFNEFKYIACEKTVLLLLGLFE